MLGAKKVKKMLPLQNLRKFNKIPEAAHMEYNMAFIICDLKENNDNKK